MSFDSVIINNGSIFEEKTNPTPSTSKNTKKFDLSAIQECLSEITKEKNSNETNVDAEDDIQLTGLDKIPDVVKSLRTFSGEPSEFGSWKKSVERIITLYEHLKGTPKYYGILTSIRNKIIGTADIALESYNTPLNWKEISKCLTLHYADKRDIGTLEYQMTTLVQHNQSIPEFYQCVYQHLSLILNKLASMDMGNESLTIMTETYRDKALDTFVRGLKGDLPRLLSMREPEDLPEALHLCLKLENIDYRIQHSHRATFTQKQINDNAVKRNNYNSQYKSPFEPKLNFYPELLHNPQRPRTPFFTPRNQRQFFPRQNFRPFYQSRNQSYSLQNHKPPSFRNQGRSYPEPMEVDNTISYQKRQPINKRQSSQQLHQQPNKFQRIFHTERYINEQDNIDHYEQNANADNNIMSDQATENDEFLEPDNINFLG